MSQNTPFARKKLIGLQALRGIAIFFVVLLHLTAIERKFGPGVTILPNWLSHGSPGIDLFFAISGFMMVTISRGHFRSRANAINFGFARFIRIYPLYWLYTAMALVAYLINPMLVNTAQSNQADFVASFLLLPSDLIPLINVAWTLVHQVYFYLVFTVFILLIEERYLPFALAGWASVIGVGQVYCLGFANCNPALNLITHPHTLEFIAGCAIAILSQHRINQLGRTTLLAGLVLWIVTMIAINALEPGLVVSGWQRVLRFAPPALLTLYGMVALEATTPITAPPILLQIGDASYSIFLSHVPLLSLLSRIWALVVTPDPLNHFIALTIMLVTVIAFGLFSYRYIEKPLIQKLRTWGDTHLLKDKITL